MSAATGSIYDLGYRRYDGPRLGRRHAIGALLAHTLRSCYGIGRGGRAKIAPIVLLGMAVIPAIIAVGVVALARQAGQAGEFLEEASPLRYDNYFGVIGQIIVLFCAAQAPELVGRDQRYSVLSLYFSRALERGDYALSKLAGFVGGILVLALVPQLIIVFGLVFSSPDLAEGLGENAPELAPILGQGLVLAAVLGSISLAIAAFTPRRAYATVAIIAAMIVPPVVVEVSRELGAPELSRWLVLVSPPDLVTGTNAWFFGVSPDSRAVFLADHPGELYLVVAALWVAACAAILLRRYERIPA